MDSLYSQVKDNTPVLVGCSQYLDKKGPDGLNYLDILSASSKKALEDCKYNYWEACSKFDDLRDYDGSLETHWYEEDDE